MQNSPKSTIIISVYKDTESLDLILEALSRQTILPDEVLVSEDGEFEPMAEAAKQAREKYANLNITHLTQPDEGWRKNRALNRAVVAAQNEYLIFIDGDCVPFDDFVENHVMQAERRVVLAGKRVMLGEKITAKIKNRELSTSKLSQNYIWFLPALIRDKTRHLEDIFHIAHNSILAPAFRRKARNIIGCNWSAFKEDIIAINGFDEVYVSPSIGEDTDLGWRFRGLGIEMKSCKYNANLFHLWHKKGFDETLNEKNRAIMLKSQAQNIYFCKDGIKKS